MDLCLGRIVRLLLDAERLSDVSVRLQRALSAGAPAADKAAWVDGFFSDGALLLIHDAELRGLLDAWVCQLDDAQFVDMLPLLRRTFGTFAAAERQAIAERIASGGRSHRSAAGRGVRRRAGGAGAGDRRSHSGQASWLRHQSLSVSPGRKRWRMLLGEASADELATSLSREEQRMDAALGALYDAEEEEGLDVPRRSRGLGSSAPRVARWLGDIRTYFPTSVVQVMQRDAIERLHLTSMLLEPELLDSIQPDVHLASSLVSLSHVMPESTKRTARVVVGQVVAEVERRIANKTRAAVTGAVRRASRTSRPRAADIDWNATIRRNLASLPSRAAHHRPRAAGGLRPGRACHGERGGRRHRSVRIDG